MSYFLPCLQFTWMPDNDGQPIHDTAGDTGSWTAWGVTLASFAAWRRSAGFRAPTTAALLSSATKTTLQTVIYDDFWLPGTLDKLEHGSDLMQFDFGFTAGPGTATKLLQHIVGATVDGIMGPHTLAAANAKGAAVLVPVLYSAQVDFYTALNRPEFLNGWLRRTDDRYALANTMAGLAPAGCAPKAIAPVGAPSPLHVLSQGEIDSALQAVIGA